MFRTKGNVSRCFPNRTGKAMSERGSIWRKWDLHIHTPASYEWEGPRFVRWAECEVSIRLMIEAINASDVAAFCIMDYWTFDGYDRLRTFTQSHPALLKKKVFPGMELRCASPSEKRLNAHVILSDELSFQQLQDFRSRLRLIHPDRPLSDEALIEAAKTLTDRQLVTSGGKRTTDAECLQTGAKTALITHASFFEAIRSLPGQCFYVQPWETYGGLTGIDFNTHSIQVRDFMRRADFFETRHPANIDLFMGRKTEKNEKFFAEFQQWIGHAKPVVSGSDAHAYAKYGKFPSSPKDGTSIIGILGNSI